MQTWSSSLQNIPLILNQIRPNLVLTYKIYFFTIFFYAWYSNVNIFGVIQEKLIFYHLYTYFKWLLLTQKLFDWPGFLQVQDIPYIHIFFVFLFFESYRFLKIMKRKYKKNRISRLPSWIFGGRLGFTIGTFLTLYPLHSNDHLYQFW